jgi:hypothetical protein
MDASLPILVSLAGFTVAGIGLIGVLAPDKLRLFLSDWRVMTSLPVTVVIRLLLGGIFVASASDCRLPTVVHLVGILELASAAVLLGLGSRRLESFVEWWLQRPTSFVRYWCLGASGLGALLVYGGA